MNTLLCILARGLIALLQVCPLRLAVRIGRWGGGLFYWVDARHRKVALRNLDRCFGAELTPRALRALARENFRRLGENYIGAIKTAFMKPEDLRGVFEIVGEEKVRTPESRTPRASKIFALGHFGNFELFAHYGQFQSSYRPAATYRALKNPALNQLLTSLRKRSGCWFFERRTESKALKAAMAQGGMMLGLLADQHAGNRGLWLPFLGHPCSTSAAPAIFALRYRCHLHTAICYRTDLARWRIEVGDEIPTHENGRARPVRDIALDMNRAFEIAVRRDPANWFWVHNRWKSPPRNLRAKSRLEQARATHASN